MNGMAGITSTDLWLGALAAALIDCGLVVLAIRFVSAESFRQLKWYLVAAAALTYGALWAVFGSVVFWRPVYRFVFPDWSRWALPVFFGALDGLAALAFWWISTRVGKWQVALFIILAGPWSVLGHGIAMLQGLLRVSFLEHASATSALVFAAFEYMLYECLVVGQAVGARCVSASLKGVARRPTRR